MSTDRRVRVGLLALSVVAALAGGLSAQSPESSTPVCERDECRWLVSCHDTWGFLTGCDVLPGGTCKTYSCDAE